MKYYIKTMKTGIEKPVEFNAIANTITNYIKLNFLGFGFYKAIKTGRNEYDIICKFDNSVSYKIRGSK